MSPDTLEQSVRESWEAQYFRNEQSPGCSTVVRTEPHGLRFEQSFWPYPEIRLTRGQWPGEAVRLDRGEEILVVPDRRFLLAAHLHAPHLKQEAPDPPAKSTLIVLLLAGVATVAALVAGVVIVLPPIASGVSAVVPVALEEQIGREIARTLAQEAAPCSDEELNYAVEQIMQRLNAADASPYSFRVTIADDMAVNALAMPGGYVVIFRGLLRLTEHPEELAGVLAHEMQHVIQRHSTRGLLRAAGVRGLLGILFGDSGGASTIAARLTELSFSRADEESADRDGMRLLIASRIDPQRMVSIFRRVWSEENAPGPPQYLSTHPATDDRIRNLEGMATALRDPRQPISIPDWARVAQACR